MATSSRQTSVTKQATESGSKSRSTQAKTGQVTPQVQAGYEAASQPYTQSQTVTDAYGALQAALANKPGDFSSAYKANLADIYQKVINRPDFTYDVNKDAFYNQYKQNYQRMGQQAMKDTMAQASSMAGGYGNSYAGTVGQQQYQNYLTELNNIVPTLRQQAAQIYAQEGDKLLQQANLTQQLYEDDYQKYRDAVADYQADRGYYTGRYQTERDFDYNKFKDDRNYFSDQYWNMRDSENTNTDASENWSNSTSTTDSTSTSTSGGSGGGKSKEKQKEDYLKLLQEKMGKKEKRTGAAMAGEISTGRTEKTLSIPTQNRYLRMAQYVADPEDYYFSLVENGELSKEDAFFLLDRTNAMQDKDLLADWTAKQAEKDLTEQEIERLKKKGLI